MRAGPETLMGVRGLGPDHGRAIARSSPDRKRGTDSAFVTPLGNSFGNGRDGGNMIVGPDEDERVAWAARALEQSIAEIQQRAIP